MTPKELAAICAREKAASEGPWYSGKWDGVWVSNGTGEREICNGVQSNRKDQEFIAHARKDVPDLLDEVKKLREVVVAFTEAFSGFLDHRLAGDLLTEKEQRQQAAFSKAWYALYPPPEPTLSYVNKDGKVVKAHTFMGDRKEIKPGVEEVEDAAPTPPTGRERILRWGLHGDLVSSPDFVGDKEDADGK